MPGAQHLSDSADLIKMLRAQLDQNKVVGAICAAPAVILAHHNLIPGRQATCYPAGKFMAKIDKSWKVCSERHWQSGLEKK
eukprot:gene15685-11226_t